MSNTTELNLDIGDHSLNRFDVKVFTEIIQPYKLVHVRDYRSINQDDLLHDLYEQFCLSDFSTTIEIAIEQYNSTIRSVILTNTHLQSLRESKIFHLALGLTKIICYYVGREEKPKECLKNQTFYSQAYVLRSTANNVLI